MVTRRDFSPEARSAFQRRLLESCRASCADIEARAAPSPPSGRPPHCGDPPPVRQRRHEFRGSMAPKQRRAA